MRPAFFVHHYAAFGSEHSCSNANRSADFHFRLPAFFSAPGVRSTHPKSFDSRRRCRALRSPFCRVESHAATTRSDRLRWRLRRIRHSYVLPGTVCARSFSPRQVAEPSVSCRKFLVQFPSRFIRKAAPGKRFRRWCTAFRRRGSTVNAGCAAGAVMCGEWHAPRPVALAA